MLQDRVRLTLLTLGLMWAMPAHPYQLPDSYLAMPVLLDDDASGIYLQHRHSIYLVTARHVLFDREGSGLRRPRVMLRSYTKSRSIPEPTVFELDLETLERSHRILSSKKDDLVAVRIGDVKSREGTAVHWLTSPGVVPQAQPGPVQIILGADEWRLIAETGVGNDVFIAMTEQLEGGRPLLLQGTLAQKDRDTRSFIVNVRVMPKNLGGPAVEVEEVGMRSREPNFIGIVVRRIPREGSLDASERVVVASVDAILDLIDRP